MVDDYHCKSCNYITTIKCNYDKHLNTKKHKKSTQSQQLVNKKSTLLLQAKFRASIVISFSPQSKPCTDISNIRAGKTRMKI